MYTPPTVETIRAKLSVFQLKFKPRIIIKQWDHTDQWSPPLDIFLSGFLRYFNLLPRSGPPQYRYCQPSPPLPNVVWPQVWPPVAGCEARFITGSGPGNSWCSVSSVSPPSSSRSPTSTPSTPAGCTAPWPGPVSSSWSRCSWWPRWPGASPSPGPSPRPPPAPARPPAWSWLSCSPSPGWQLQPGSSSG